MLKGRYAILFWTFLTIVGLWAFLRTDFVETVLLFVFLGLIPGTSITVPAWLIIVMAIISSIGLIAWLRRQPLYIGSRSAQEKTARRLARKRVGQKAAVARRKHHAKRVVTS